MPMPIECRLSRKLPFPADACVRFPLYRSIFDPEPVSLAIAFSLQLCLSAVCSRRAMASRPAARRGTLIQSTKRSSPRARASASRLAAGHAVTLTLGRRRRRLVVLVLASSMLRLRYVLPAATDLGAAAAAAACSMLIVKTSCRRTM